MNNIDYLVLCKRIENIEEVLNITYEPPSREQILQLRKETDLGLHDCACLLKFFDGDYGAVINNLR